MRFFAVIAGVQVALTLAACGSSGDVGREKSSRVVQVAGPHGTLRLRIPTGPPPKDLVVVDLRKGTGPAVRSVDDTILVKYLGLNFSDRKPFYDGWESSGTSRFILHETHPGWEIGLKGMRQGGLRELVTPPRMEYGTTTIVYVIEMVKVRHRLS
jgi:FKBP-type peptidyl-prolyl cis-trans isomerase